MNETLPPTATPAPKKSKALKIYAVVLTIVFVISFFMNLALLGAVAMLLSGEGEPALKEVVSGGERDSKNKIAIIEIENMVSSSMVERVKPRLEAALKDDAVKAVVLEVNSPGGAVTASDTIYDMVKKADAKKPVVVHISTVGASGAYYIAMGARRVIVEETGITGSIGVIGQVPNFKGLMTKYGVEMTTFKSGKNKDMMNPFDKLERPETEENKKIFQGLIDEMYERFFGIVAASRKNLSAEKLHELADGRVFTGKKAKEVGLVDDTGRFEDAIAAAKSLAKIENAQQIRYVVPFSLANALSIFSAKAASPSLQVNVDVLPSVFRLEAGKLYYLYSESVGNAEP